MFKTLHTYAFIPDSDDFLSENVTIAGTIKVIFHEYDHIMLDIGMEKPSYFNCVNVGGKAVCPRIYLSMNADGIWEYDDMYYGMPESHIVKEDLTDEETITLYTELTHIFNSIWSKMPLIERLQLLAKVINLQMKEVERLIQEKRKEIVQLSYDNAQLEIAMMNIILDPEMVKNKQ